MSAVFDAHLRLSAQLPKRTHEWTPPQSTHEKRVERAAYDRQRRAKNPGAGRGGQNARPVTVDGKTYGSVLAVARAYHIGNGRVYDWLRTGRATREP